MSQLPQVSWDVVLLVARSLALVVGFVLAAYTFARWRQASQRAEELFAQQNSALLARLQVVEEQLTTIQARQAETREQLAAIATLAERLQEGEPRRTPAPSPAAAPSYQIAIRLARSGAPVDELVTSCGLSRQEAELVQRLHAPARTPRLALAR